MAIIRCPYGSLSVEVENDWAINGHLPWYACTDLLKIPVEALDHPKILATPPGLYLWRQVRYLNHEIAEAKAYDVNRNAAKALGVWRKLMNRPGGKPSRHKAYTEGVHLQRWRNKRLSADAEDWWASRHKVPHYVLCDLLHTNLITVAKYPISYIYELGVFDWPQARSNLRAAAERYNVPRNTVEALAMWRAQVTK